MAGAQVTTPMGLAQEFERHAILAHTRVRFAATQWAKQFIEQVQKNASGAPGPEIRTGEYVNSFFYDVHDEGIEISVDIGSSAPQMFRLEYGFSGTDSLGRQYHDPPLPHWRPALDALGEFALEETMAYAVDFDAV